MPESQKPSINSWLEDELYHQYLHDRQTVDTDWMEVFESNGHPAPSNGAAAAIAPVTKPAVAPQLPEGDQLVPLRGPALRIAENMTASLTMPVASSQRAMPVKVIDENRRLINERRSMSGKSKISYTHLVAWAIVKAVEKVPALNQAYSENGDESFRITHQNVNLGIAVDVAGKDGARSLKVPSIKGAQAMDFAQFLAAFDDLVARARTNKLLVSDFEGTTISLTNPGTVGTMGSTPRLMPGQGAIIATGAIDYPPEYRGVPEETRTSLGLSKVMTVTCTYDHRVIQGAESGQFLGHLQALLEGEHGFYDSILESLGIPMRAFRWEPDQSPAPVINADPMKQAAVAKLIQAWRERGHLVADLDPLGVPRASHPDLEPSTHGLTIWDLDRSFHAGSFGVMTLRALIDRLRQTYAGKIGVQWMHIDNIEERNWLEQRMEPTQNQWPLDPALKRRVLQDVIGAESFENFLDTRFKGHKRFGLEGGESAIAIIEEILDRAANAGTKEVVIGMAHRGRLVVLANIAGKSMVQLFAEFEGDDDPDSIEGSGDVKYHLGGEQERTLPSGKKIKVTVAFNPSHLEAVNPVVEGFVRAEQDMLKDTRREKVLPLVIHGDAAMAGQGIVAEAFNYSKIPGYDTGGTIHLVINNQIGFTTTASAARSSTYCSDVALSVQAPVFHVNGNDPEACVRATQISSDYRQRFHRDVVIDLICYRKNGHNEGDDPSYTQPVMYRKIKAQKPVAAIYGERLEHEGLVTSKEVTDWYEDQKKRLYAIYDEAQNNKDAVEVQVVSMPAESSLVVQPATGIERSVFDRVVTAMTTFPADFHLHPKLAGLIQKRRAVLEGAPIDWAMAELLAFGSLASEGHPVRLSGQDSGRGTFSQRHGEYHDYESDRVFVPLSQVGPFEVYNSPLSEYAVMGFEYGYSAADLNALVAWEAQYGDFSNGGQIITDQFISSAESKWNLKSALVLLLPHGQEGGGPEHSSARLERFLQLSGEYNMRVVNLTTPAQHFHVLRRQLKGPSRKPLIVMTPKSLLRHPKVFSSIDELTRGSVFHPVLADSTVADPSLVRKILVCSGKIYYELLAARDARKLTDTAIVRTEQLYPFPEMEFNEVLRRYPAASQVVWVQEEPRNMGAWGFVRGYIQPVLDRQGRTIGYAGRPESASPSPGSLKRHNQEQAQLIEEAFAPPTVERRRNKRLIRRRRRQQV
ncbi:MAG TPA: multifunctional oxoglutarate decarboxylase/oxoglutarate dehydrogenase thiamine pyrophosphate-binding subunit/dihydrolipoyllysine-residue succinyltransferase subunit [Bryobacteraceae bacterium]|jgi:2-oxoglutarate decarboxylase|nr:multifunctional oxoglutarate decarboxylase/oxoglutarate dehydrogenase thiamine pyrophosphate-binding subunit/dihydrolipoyllysine-residue succinyltransferase subunit [Bryobacteraceae bacterium]